MSQGPAMRSHVLYYDGALSQNKSFFPKIAPASYLSYNDMQITTEVYYEKMLAWRENSG